MAKELIAKTYAFIRDSAEQQDLEGQHREIECYCATHGIRIDKWLLVEISNRKTLRKRRFEQLMPLLKEGDTLIVADEGADMRHIGRVFACKGYLAGNRKTVSFEPSAGKEAACVAAAGDYVFTGGWKERGRIGINRLSDGTEVGLFEPGPTVGGVENTGWIDILTGITAFRRANGEYLVFVEEDYKAKVLMYRWKP